MSIGETLASARAAAGLTTADVAERTRIRRTLIEAIENDDYRLCGGDVYARGHIGTIARTVGTGSGTPAGGVRPYAPRGRTARGPARSSRPTRRCTPSAVGPNWSAAMVVALVVVVGLVGWQLHRGAAAARRARPPRAAKWSPAPTSPRARRRPRGRRPRPCRSRSSSAAHSSDLAQVPQPKGVTVKVSAVAGNCWVQAKTGGHVVFEATLRAGDSQTFTDSKQVKLILGNSGAVRLTVNGHNLGAPAGSGQISKLTFGPGDPNGAG